MLDWMAPAGGPQWSRHGMGTSGKTPMCVIPSASGLALSSDVTDYREATATDVENLTSVRVLFVSPPHPDSDLIGSNW